MRTELREKAWFRGYPTRTPSVFPPTHLIVGARNCEGGGLVSRLHYEYVRIYIPFSAGAKRPLSVIGGNFVRGMTVRDVRLVRYSEVRGVCISEVEMYGVHAVVGRGHADCPL